MTIDEVDGILFDDDDVEDVEEPVGAPVTAERTAWLFRKARELHARIDEYDALHQREIDLLNERRQEVIGPLVDQLDALEVEARQFAIAMWDRDKRGSFEFPYGSIKSRAAIEEFTVVDETVAMWAPGLAANYEIDESLLVKRTPKVYLKPLREVLARLELDGVVARAIDVGSDEEMLVPSPELRWQPTWKGVFLDTLTSEVMPGLTWVPGGDDFRGRRWTINL